MLVEQLLLGVALPALVTAIVVVICLQPWRAPDNGRGAWAAGLGLGAGYISGHLALFGWPGFAPKESWQWLPHIAALVTAAALLVGRPRLARLHGWATIVLIAAAAAWLLAPQWQEARLIWIIALAATAIVVWIALLTLARRTSTALPPLVLLIAASAAALILERAATAKFAQLAGVLAASSGACLVVAALWPATRMGPGLAGGGAVLLVGLMFTGYFNHYGDIHAASFLLVAAAPLAAWIGQWGSIRTRRSWQLLVIEAAAVLLPAGVALALVFAGAGTN